MKLVVIGLGFLAQYVMPCYKKLLGDEIGTSMIGIKGSSRALEQTQAACPFPVQVQGSREALEAMRPDLIILAVKPHQIAAMTRETVAPYYQMLREKGEKLPDLYSFAPDPTVDFFYDTIGPDVNAANMIPNMVSDICGHDVSQVGVSFVAFDRRRTWPEENKKRALAFMKPTGTVLEIDDDKAIPFLSMQCACHLMFDFCYIAQDVLTEAGQAVTLPQVASAYRAVYRAICDDDTARVLPDSADAVSADMQRFMRTLLGAWHKGVLRFAASEGIPTPQATRNVYGSMETYLMEAQLEPKEQLEQNTKNHATPGGFLEMCIKTFHNGGYAYTQDALRSWLAGQAPADFDAAVQDIAFAVAKAISDHGKTVSGVKK